METISDFIIFCLKGCIVILFMWLCMLGIAKLFWKFDESSNKNEGKNNIKENNDELFK